MPGCFLELLSTDADFVPPAPDAPVAPFAGFLAAYLARREGLADFENSVKTDTGVYPHITKVADQLGDQADQGEQIQRAHDHGVVPSDHAFIAEQAQAVEGKQGFNQQ
jgi:hypothetical protein